MERRMWLAMGLSSLAITTALLWSPISQWVYLELQIYGRLNLMKYLNSAEKKTEVRGWFDEELDFIQLTEWVNQQLVFDKNYAGLRPDDPTKIREGGKGQCEEFSILYASACIAHGYRVRLVDQGINTFTVADDHMWVEVWVDSEWVHVDPSPPPRRNEPNMYEDWSWGRDLGSVILAFEDRTYEDVTKKYKGGS